jgi:hypothetical protein
MNLYNEEESIVVGIFSKSPRRLRDEAAQGVETKKQGHGNAVERYNGERDKLATMKRKRLDDRNAAMANVVASGGTAEDIVDDPALIQAIAKQKLFCQALFRAAEDARLAVINATEALVAAERTAAVAAYIDQARLIYRVLGQLVPANEKLASMQTRDLPLLSLPWLSKEWWDAWQREYLAFVEPKPRPVADPNTTITFIKPYSPGGLSGIRYNPDEGAAFAPEKAAEIVAGRFAVLADAHGRKRKADRSSQAQTRSHRPSGQRAHH